MDSREDNAKHGFLSQPSLASKILVTSLIIVSISMLASLATTVYQAANSVNEQTSVNSSEFQAVFLTNNQTYFGKIKGISNDAITLSNVYYLQGQQSTSNSQQPNLVKLGNEVHGPEDMMHISRAQLLYWENMKNDSKITKAISDYQSKN